MSETSQKPLDLESLERLTVRLQEAISAFGNEPQNLFYLDSVVKRFELTFEIARKLLRRYLIDIDPANAKIPPDQLQEFVRLGNAQNLLLGSWDEWKRIAMPETIPCMDTVRRRRGRSQPWQDRSWRKRSSCWKISSGGLERMPTEAGVDVSERDLVAIGSVLQQHAQGRPAFLFGSRVTGLARPDSDLDLAIGGECPLTIHERGTLKDALEEIGLDFKIDVIDLHDARGVFRKRIEAEWIPWEQAKVTRPKAVA